MANKIKLRNSSEETHLSDLSAGSTSQEHISCFKLK